MSRPSPVDLTAGVEPQVLCWLADLGQLLAAELSVGVVLDGILQRLLSATGVEAAECFLREPHSGHMVLGALQGLDQRAFREITQFRTGEGFPGLVATRAEPLITFDLPSDQRFLRTAVKTAGYMAYLCVPLLGSNRVLGSLHLASRRRDDDLMKHLPLLKAVAGPLALAVARDQAQIALGLAAVLAGSQGAPAVRVRASTAASPSPAASVMWHAVVTTAADGGALFRYDPSGNSLEVVASSGPHASLSTTVDSPTAEANCPLARPTAAVPQLFSWQAATAIRDGCAKSGFCRAIHAQLKAGICLRLVREKQLVGIMTLGWRRSPAVPTQAFAWLGGHASSATWALTDRTAPESGVEVPVVSLLDHGGTTTVHTAETIAPLAIRCLGTCTLLRHGIAVEDEVWRRPKFRRLFAFLLTHRQQWVHREVLTEAFWPDLAPAAARHNLRVALAALRRALEADLPAAAPSRFVARQGDLLRLRLPKDVWLDVVEFEQLSQPAVDTPELSERDLERLTMAAALYRGDYLPDELYETWAMDERQRLLDRYLTVLERLADAWSARGRFELSARYRRRLLTRDPANETAHRGLMADLAASGRRSEALRHYELCRELLRRELDVDPLPETTNLYRKILAR
jgi:DNA-binding SARP family transcriptional activator